MTETAKKIGLTNSMFANSTGWPHPDHKMFFEDLAKLAKLIIEEFEDYYHLFSQKEFTHNGIKQGNRKRFQCL
jgi:D-alanyl-D-alanine carboxypeptidase (penicillin-binding protein 5/6)